MHRTPWFDRRFPPIEDNGLLPGIIERLEGTAPRLRSLLVGVERASPLTRGGASLRRSGTSSTWAYFVAEYDDHHLARLGELTTTYGTHSREL